MRVRIAVTAGPHQGRVFEFAGHDVFLVGRSKKAHFRLPQADDYFSRLHFMVEVNPPHCRLTDLGSTNGTFVNGEKVASAELRDGSRIQGGRTVMVVNIEPGEEELSRRAEPPGGPAESLVTEAAAPVPPPQESLRAACAVCGSPAPAVPAGTDAEQTTVAPWPLCSGCRRQSRQQPQPFPDYLLVRELGRGGLGIVHLALDQRRGQVAALKTILPAAQAGRAEVERFLREARILQQLSHPNIVAFREMGESCGQFFFAMDFVAGEDAGSLLRRLGPLPLRRAVSIVAQALDGLAAAHQLGFVHRDVKPANLQLAEGEGGDCVKILDFGLARTYQMSRLSGLSHMGQVGGTVAYMAPEQITHFRESRPPVDQYAAAATLYHLLTGKHVHDFPADFQQRLLKVLNADPVPLRARRPEVPEALAAAVYRALAREPEKRFPDAAAFRAALLAISL
jgi:serine/threonine-protein kinase